MPSFKRLVAQVHDITADTPQQADEIARVRANSINVAMRLVFSAGAAWAPSVADGVSGADELMEILENVFVGDEIDDGSERNPYPGYLPAEKTVVPDRLMAWRDAAVKAALDAQNTAQGSPSKLMQLLDVIRAEDGLWMPHRALAAYARLGWACTIARARTNLRLLMEYGYLERVEPMKDVYRLSQSASVPTMQVPR